MGLAEVREPIVDANGDAPWLLRAARRLSAWARPSHGWTVLLTLALLSALPAIAIRANRWLNLGSQQAALEWSGPLAVAAVWLLWGWRVPAARRRGVLRGTVAFLLGPLVVGQLLLGWIPGPAAVVRAIQFGDALPLLMQPFSTWVGFVIRVDLWWQGVQSGTAAQDNLVFTMLGATLVWWVTCVGAWLARRTGQGLAAAAPSLWLLGTVLLYSSSGRSILLAGLALAITLQLLFDHHDLVVRWQRMGLDYSPALLLDRAFAVLSALALVLTLAAVMPNLYWEPLVMRYYGLIAPWNARLEALGDQLFPEVRGTSRLRGGSAGGLPNDFLLQGGAEPGATVVMRVRTDETPIFEFPSGEMAAPTGHYMRGGTLAVYTGRGWRNPVELKSVELDADERYLVTTVGHVPFTIDTGHLSDGLDGAWGRRELNQSVIMEASSTVLFAAAEPVSFSVDARLETIAGDAGVALPVVDDLLAAYARARSYTAVSSIPALDERTLRLLPLVEPDARLARYLALPDTITPRTEALAEELTAQAETAYDKALAIETYLRQYVYDLTIPEPPEQVEDVADYFMFDLQRGYCDYYTTAFVVLARLAGLPTRFATGYAPGQWDFAEGVWTITEAEAHSWPEVFFADVGWIAFEPTAGRPVLTRIGAPQFALTVPPLPAQSQETTEPEVEAAAEAESQLWFWLIPGALAVWGVLWLVQLLLRRREDPWQTVLRWGARAGRPLGQGETVLEYGDALAELVLRAPSARRAEVRSGETGRVVARELRGLSRVVNRWVYGPPAQRGATQQALRVQWARTGGVLRAMRVRDLKDGGRDARSDQSEE